MPWLLVAAQTVRGSSPVDAYYHVSDQNNTDVDAACHRGCRIISTGAVDSSLFLHQLRIEHLLTACAVRCKRVVKVKEPSLE